VGQIGTWHAAAPLTVEAMLTRLGYETLDGHLGREAWRRWGQIACEVSGGLARVQADAPGLDVM
jgi:hypothetical protein